jgi:hypothetical protein
MPIYVGRQQADKEGANPHDDDRQHEHGFATGAVAKVSKNRSAQGPRQKADGVGAESSYGA